jgi:hypothetical protein
VNTKLTPTKIPIRTIVTETDLISAVAESIARREEFYRQPRSGVPTLSRRLRNPGMIESWKDSNGVPLAAGMGVVEFSTESDGWRALRAQCRINIVKRRLTFLEFFGGRRGLYRGFRPRPAYDPTTYAAGVARCVSRLLQIDVESLLDPIDDPIIKLVNAKRG